jgi:hypothetical protein
VDQDDLVEDEGEPIPGEEPVDPEMFNEYGVLDTLNDRAGLCSCSLSSSDHAPCRIGLAVSLA